MISIPARVGMFLSSYVPLSLIFVILYSGKDAWVCGVSVAALALGLGAVLWILPATRAKTTAYSRTIVEFRKPGDATMGYVASYLVPFVGFPLGPWRENCAFAIFVAVLALIYTNTDMLHINPMLQAFRYNVYEVTFETGTQQYLITKRHISRNDILEVVLLDRGLWIEGANQ